VPPLGEFCKAYRHNGEIWSPFRRCAHSTVVRKMHVTFSSGHDSAVDYVDRGYICAPYSKRNPSEMKCLRSGMGLAYSVIATQALADCVDRCPRDWPCQTDLEVMV
jgi:hypothetical protein